MLTPIAAQDHERPPPFVLVADDDESLRSLIVEVLKHVGLGALVASDGAEAVAIAAKHKDALLGAILDVRMPVLDGLGAARAIRATAPSLPIIMMSSEFPPGYHQQFAPLDIAHILDKPFRIRELVETIRAVLMGSPAAPTPATDAPAAQQPPDAERQDYRQH